MKILVMPKISTICFIKKGSDKLLENPFIQLYNQREYSTFYQKQGLLFDQIILSEKIFIHKVLFLNLRKQKFSHQDGKNKDRRHQENLLGLILEQGI